MIRFLKQSILFFLGFLALVTIIYLCRPKTSENYLAAINPKINLLDSIQSPRIIFVGGSNVCFGIDSKTISDSIGLPVIDFALHAGVGLKAYIDIVTKKSRPDDIIIIMPEIQQFYGQFNGQSSVLSPLFLLSKHKYRIEILKTLNIAQTFNIIGGFPKALYDVYRSKNVSDSIYNVCGFNEFGDHNSHWTVEKPSKFNNLSPITTSIDSYAIEYTKKKVAELKNQGTRVLIFPPTVTESYYNSELEKFNELYTNFSSAEIDFSVPSDSHSVLDEYCFDGIYHRDKRGVDMVTQKLITEFKDFEEDKASEKDK